MPRDGAIIFGVLIGKLDDVRVLCSACGRSGRYRLQGLIATSRGRNGKIIDWLDTIAADCPKKAVHNIKDQCGARCRRCYKWLGA